MTFSFWHKDLPMESGSKVEYIGNHLGRKEEPHRLAHVSLILHHQPFQGCLMYHLSLEKCLFRHLLHQQIVQYVVQSYDHHQQTALHPA